MSRDYHCPITTTVTSCPRTTHRFGNRQFQNKKWELSQSYRRPGVTQSMSFLFNNSRLRISTSVRDWLNITVPNQWIGREEPPDKACIAWPPHPPDLAICDLSVGDHKGLRVRISSIR
ncbi:hypothetical protein TNCV_3287261 [Trichonephila clavipes]|nr:hypothetical protein TNCV_3287261 [Trichonephila clavipes]